MGFFEVIVSVLVIATVCKGQFLGLYSEAQLQEVLSKMRAENNHNMAICTSLIAEARRSAENCSKAQLEPKLRDIVYFGIDGVKKSVLVSRGQHNTSDIVVGGGLHVYDGKLVTNVNEGNFNISNFNASVKVIFSAKNRVSCQEFHDCSAFVLSPSPLKKSNGDTLQLGQCYDVLKGDVYHNAKSINTLTEFRVLKMIPLTLLCDNDQIKRLFHRSLMVGYGDFFSSIEDWIADELNTTIGGVTDLVNSLTDQVTSGFSSLETSIQSQTSILSEEVANATNEFGKQITGLSEQVDAGIASIERQFGEQLTELSEQVSSGIGKVETQLQVKAKIISQKLENASTEVKATVSGMETEVSEEFQLFGKGVHELL